MNNYGEIILVDNIDSEDKETHEIYFSVGGACRSIVSKYDEVINNIDMNQKVDTITHKSMDECLAIFN